MTTTQHHLIWNTLGRLLLLTDTTTLMAYKSGICTGAYYTLAQHPIKTLQL